MHGPCLQVAAPQLHGAGDKRLLDSAEGMCPTDWVFSKLLRGHTDTGAVHRRLWIVCLVLHTGMLTPHPVAPLTWSPNTARTTSAPSPDWSPFSTRCRASCRLLCSCAAEQEPKVISLLHCCRGQIAISPYLGTCRLCACCCSSAPLQPPRRLLTANNGQLICWSVGSAALLYAVQAVASNSSTTRHLMKATRGF